MKRNLFSLMAVLVAVIIFISCNQSGKNAGSSDTSKVSTDTSTARMKPQRLGLVFSTNSADQIITPETEEKYRSIYVQHPVFKDNLGGDIWGFMLDTAKDAQGNAIDFLTIKKLKNIDNVYVKFGIKDSTIDEHGQVQYTYTIMIVPLDKSWHPITNSQTVGGTNISGSAYDVACPCVNGKGCCPM